MKRKRHLPSETLTGVTTKRGKVVRVCFGRNTIIRLSELDDQAARSLIKKARAWLKPPAGSIPIIGCNKPPDKPEHGLTWKAPEDFY